MKAKPVIPIIVIVIVVMLVLIGMIASIVAIPLGFLNNSHPQLEPESYPIISDVQIDVHPDKFIIRWQTDTPCTCMVQLCLDDDSCQIHEVEGLNVEHEIEIPITPSTQYHITIIATNQKDKQAIYELLELGTVIDRS